MKTLSATDTLVAAPEDGVSVTIESIMYATGTDGTTLPSSGWSTTIPSVPKGSYLWTRVKFSNGEYSYTCAYHGKDGTGIQGDVGPLPYPCGSYDSAVSYTRDAFKCPVVELGNIYYGMKKSGTIKGVNPKTDVANNGGNWEVFDMFKWLMSEVAFINFGKLASAIFYGQYMFSQYGIDSSGAAVTSESGYKDFNYSDPMNTANAFRPNILLDFLNGKAWLYDVFLRGVVNATSGTFNDVDILSGRIAGFSISGDSIVNSGYGNDATVIFRNDTHKTFAGIGGNVLPSSTGLRGVARFENHDKEDFWALGVNYAMLVSAQGGRENIAIQLNGGSIACLALKTQIIGHDNVVQNAAPTTKYVTLGRDVGSLYVSTQFYWKSSSSETKYSSKTRDIYVTLPAMDVYDDGHCIKIKRGSNDGGKVYISPGTSYRMVYNSSTGKYVRTYGTSYIMYDSASYATPSSKLVIESQGDAMELVYHRDLQTTINGTTYYGCWIQHKHPKNW